MDTVTLTFLVILFLGINYSSSDILGRQKRNWIIDSFQIEEEYKGSFPYVLGKIELENKFTVLKLSGQGVDKPPMGIMQIDDRTGEIQVVGKVNYEDHKTLMLQFEAFDTKKNVVDTRLAVEVRILDINDNVPTFTESYYEVNLEESATQDAYVIVVLANDLDVSTSKNGTFDLRIVSVTPKPSGFEFTMTQNGPYGNISLKGCLDYEKTKTYTILVEAKDRGEQVQQSSTCTVVVNIIDKNNYLPIFTGKTSTATVKEQEVNVSVLSLQTTDRDTKGTDAWKAKYIIHGEKSDSFRIDTNPETNEGVLYVTKPLDYEDQSALNLTISVENVGEYFSCKVLSSGGLWKVVETKGKGPPLSTRVVTVNVEDVNDPPIFIPNNKTVVVSEDIALGSFLETMTAIDKDVSHGSKIVYVKGEDPGEWVTVDSKTGVITTVKTLDRESSFVKDNIYTVTVFAIDDGEPSATGTGTLSLRLRDQNDNVPQLAMNMLDICIFDAGGSSQANLTAFDLDEEPFAGPFRFKLHGDVKNRWRINPQIGNSVKLIIEDKVHAGHHELQLEVFDQQEMSALYNLSVRVCHCKASAAWDTPGCTSRRVSSSIRVGGALAVLFMAALLLLGILLLAFLLSCKREIKLMPDEGTEQNLIPSNIEYLGSDCKVPLKREEIQHERADVIDEQYLQGTRNQVAHCGTDNGFTRTNTAEWGSDVFTSNTAHWGTANGFTGTTSASYAAWDGEDYLANPNFLQNFLDKNMKVLQAPGKELGDYAPRLYSDEGHPDSSPQLDRLSIPEDPFHPDMLLHLGPAFKNLASLCSPNYTSS